MTQLETREDFIKLLNNNTGIIILKFTAPWCRNCKLIESQVVTHFKQITEKSEYVNCLTIDVDNSIDIYALLKRKKIVTGLPVLLCYTKNNNTIFSDDSISGTNKLQIDAFFNRCENYIKNI